MREQFYQAPLGTRRPGDPLSPASYLGIAAPLAHLSTRITRIASLRGLTRIAGTDATWGTAYTQTHGLLVTASIKDAATVALSLGAAGVAQQFDGVTHEVYPVVVNDFGSERWGVTDGVLPGQSVTADKAPANGVEESVRVPSLLLDGRDIDGWGVYAWCDGPSILYACRRWGYGASCSDALDWLALGDGQYGDRTTVTTDGDPPTGTDVRTARLRLESASGSNDMCMVSVHLAASYAADTQSEP